MKPQIIAFYLPQYHPTEHNDLWWGKGFTEWTNVAKARRLYPGHYQPKIPTELGFYDLRLPEVREEQALLAKEAGIDCFCYYHYWFGPGEEELERPFREVVDCGKPDFPFCLCWANESWYKKFWNKEGALVDRKVLAEQKYGGKEDYTQHFYSLLNAFKDDRYFKVDGKLFFMIYKPLEQEEAEEFMALWQMLAKENGLPGFYFAGFTFVADSDGEAILKRGFDSVVSCRHNRDKIHNASWLIRKIASTILRMPRMIRYKKLWPQLISDLERHDNRYIPVMIPNWDHTPRSGRSGDLILNPSPEEFKKHCKDVLSSVKNKNTPICVIKSWNEWGEGNYMEPDIKYGKGYINALREALQEIE